MSRRSTRLYLVALFVLASLLIAVPVVATTIDGDTPRDPQSGPMPPGGSVTAALAEAHAQRVEGSRAHAEQAARVKQRSTRKAVAQKRAAAKRKADRRAARKAEARRKAAARAARRDQTRVPMARTSGFTMAHPAKQVRAVGFHQGGSRGHRMEPLDGSARLLPRRSGRVSDPRSAVDVAVSRNEPIRSPVDGRVVEARSYVLYGNYWDQLVVIDPSDGAPGHRLRMLHLEGLRVKPGDRVRTGDVIARNARLLPFASQIDAHAGRVPHVHLEVH